MNWFLDRLREKTTYAAIIGFVGLFGMTVEPELRDHIINALIAVASIVAFIFREKAHEPDHQPDQNALPDIELVGRSASDSEGGDTDATDSEVPSYYRGFADDRVGVERVRSQLPPRREAEQDSGWNG